MAARIPWSLDAWVLVRPAAAFQHVAANPPAGSSFRLVCSRPFFLAFAIACVASLAATGALTARIVLPVTVYSTYVPIAELIGLAVVTRRRPSGVSLPAAVDIFFSGHAAWMLWLLLFFSVLSLVPPNLWWVLILRVGLSGVVAVMAWSAYIDFQFFRHVIGATRAAALRALVVQRLISWLIVFTIFASETLTPWGAVGELVAALQEIF